MTDCQYKGLLLEDLENWQRVLNLAEEAGAEKVVDMARQQIDKINEKLKF